MGTNFSLLLLIVVFIVDTEAKKGGGGGGGNNNNGNGPGGGGGGNNNNNNNNNDIMSKLLPILAFPFLLQVTLLPAMLISLKFILFKSMILGKLAILFASLSLLKKWYSKSDEGLFSHNLNLFHDDHRRRQGLVQSSGDAIHDLQMPYAISRKRKRKMLPEMCSDCGPGDL